MLRVPFQTLSDEFYRVLTAVGFTGDRAKLCAKLFAENQRDGVYSHGLNWKVNRLITMHNQRK